MSRMEFKLNEFKSGMYAIMFRDKGELCEFSSMIEGKCRTNANLTHLISEFVCGLDVLIYKKDRRRIMWLKGDNPQACQYIKDNDVVVCDWRALCFASIEIKENDLLDFWVINMDINNFDIQEFKKGTQHIYFSSHREFIEFISMIKPYLYVYDEIVSYFDYKKHYICCCKTRGCAEPEIRFGTMYNILNIDFYKHWSELYKLELNIENTDLMEFLK